MLRKTLIFTLFCLAAISIKAQIGFGGLPPSFTSQEKRTIRAEEIAVAFDVTELIAQDLINEEEYGTPPRIAENIPVNYTVTNSGVWTSLANGDKLWQLRIRAEGALAILLAYEDFYIPEGASLFIYNEERTHLLGAYKHKTHPKGGRFSTEMIAGDDITLELVIPAGKEEIKEAVRLHISDIGYCYNHVRYFCHSELDSESSQSYKGIADQARNDSMKIGESGGCMVNINCSPEGDDWQTEKKGVTQMTMLLNSGWNVCSGTIINNTAQDLTPYLLSAFHCYENTSEERLSQWQFAFHFESPSCKTEQPTGTKTLVGCKVRAYSPLEGGSDGLLLELTTPIPEDWDVYYNGWDRRDEPVPGRGVSIHHPAGDIKKISAYDEYETGTWVSVMYGTGADDAHWLFPFVRTTNGHSVTEGGSSGSPLFSPGHLVIGSLTGGNSSCSNLSGSNFYGKLHYHWDKYGDSPTTQMKTWLDPLDSGLETLEGIFFDPVAPRLALDIKSLELDGKVGEDNPVETISISAYNLKEIVTASVTGEFELSTDQIQWGKTAEIPLEGGNLYIKYVPLTIGYDQGLVSLYSAELGATKYPRDYSVGLSANSCLDIVIENAGMPHAKVGDNYSLQLIVNGSEGPYTFSIVSGSLPEGLVFNNGSIEGTVMEDGTFTLSVAITDKYDCTTIHDVNLYVICNIVTDFPFREDFEETLLPFCWKENMEKGNLAWQFNSGVRPEYEDITTAQSGNYNALFYDSTYEANTTRLVMPQLDLSSLDNPQLSFWYVMPAWGEDLDELAVIYKTSAHSEWKTLGSYTEEITAWTEIKLNLPEPSNEYFVAFEGKSNYGFGIGIDNITVSDGPVSIQNPETDEIKVRFSNPVNGKLEIRWERTLNSLELHTLTGNTLYKIKQLENKNNISIDMSSHPKGIYLLTVRSSQGQRTYKIINN